MVAILHRMERHVYLVLLGTFVQKQVVLYHYVKMDPILFKIGPIVLFALLVTAAQILGPCQSCVQKEHIL